MTHTCRESCGVCGFFSTDNKQAQIIHKQDIKDYSNIGRDNFDCGRFDDIEKARTKRGSGGNVQSHLFSEGSITTYRQDKVEATSNYSTDFFCGATMISDKLAISAAHCFDEFEVGFDHKSRVINVIVSNSFNPEVIEILQIYKHPGYEYPEIYDDIAIIKLGKRVQYDFDNIGVTPLCVERKWVEGEQLAKVLGRGLTETGERGTLLEAEVKIIDNKKCTEILNNNATDNSLVRRKIDRALPHGLNYGQLCAVGFQNDEGVFSGACKGDSGSPLFIDENGIKELIGFWSGGIGCGKGYPGWYTRISTYIPWLDCIMEAIANNKEQNIVEGHCMKQIDAMGENISEAPFTDPLF